MNRDERQRQLDDWLSAQVAVLGSVLLDESCAPQVVARTAPEDYTDAYRPIFLVIRAKLAAGERIDPVEVRHALGEGSGGLLTRIMEVTPTAANCGEYIDLMVEQSHVRQLNVLGAELAEARDMETARKLLDRANALTVHRERVRTVTMADALRAFYDRQTRPAPDYLKWGIPELDQRLYVEPGDYVVLGGYSSDGKTALALSMAFQQGQTRRVGFFSFETRDHKLFDRLVPTVARIDFGRVKRHNLDANDWETLSAHTQVITSNHLELIQANGMTVADIQAVAQSRRLEVVYVDYLQLITPDDSRQSQFDQVTQISMTLHNLSQRTGITVVALSQLSRPESTKGPDKKQVNKAPTMHSLRQSGQIEQDADAILLVYRENPNDKKSRRIIKVAKNKEGEAGGVITMAFDGAHQRFAVDKSAVWEQCKKEALASRRTQNASSEVPVFQGILEGEQEEIPF